jgi:signal transduction histidine kinase/integral membrane sensor domain MASE1
MSTALASQAAILETAGPVPRAREPQAALPRRWRVWGPVALAGAYFVGSLIGLELVLPGTPISAIWPPNALVLAALLLAPPRRWWLYILAVLPGHVLAQALAGIPTPAMLVNFLGNTGEAVVAAVPLLLAARKPFRIESLRTLLLLVVFGGLLAPAIVSLLVAVFLASPSEVWLTWWLRLLTNLFAVLTLVPPIVLVGTRIREGRRPFEIERRAEATILAAGLALLALPALALTHSGPIATLVVLYLPLPLLLWAAVRFGLLGVCLSSLALEAFAMWTVLRVHGLFDQPPLASATYLVLFLVITCVPLLLLAAVLEEREGALRGQTRTQALHSSVLASLRDHIAVLDREGVVVEANDAWRNFAREHRCHNRVAAGSSYLEACSASTDADPPEAGACARSGIEDVLAGERDRIELEYSWTSPNGRRFWFTFEAQALRRAEGGAVIAHTDVTARKRAEHEAQTQRNELAHVARVATLGEISGALAHELSQPLAAILSNAQAAQIFLRREKPDLVEIGEILDEIVSNDRHAGEVIHRLRTMLRKDAPKASRLEPNELVIEALSLARGDLVTRSVEVATSLTHGLPPVLADRVQMQQVLLNLILNACEAMSNGTGRARELTVKTLATAAEVHTEVIDTGNGVPAGDAERIFEPFFTSKPNGLGLGLTICRSIVEAHGGRLWAANDERGGARFIVALPLVRDG